MTQSDRHELAGEASRLLKADQDAKALTILEKLSIMLPDHVDIQTTRAFCLARISHMEKGALGSSSSFKPINKGRSVARLQNTGESNG